MNELAFLFLFCLIIFIAFQFYYHQRKKKQLADSILSSWGREKDKQYYNFEIIARYWKKSKHKEDCYQSIEENTIEDLDLKVLFKFINRTFSSIGEQYLYFKMLCIPQPKSYSHSTEFVNYFKQNVDDRIKIQTSLSKLSTPFGYFIEKLIHDKHITPPVYYKYYFINILLTISCIIAIPFFPILIIGLIPLFVINMGLHYSNKKNIDQYAEGLSYLFLMIKSYQELVPMTSKFLSPVDIKPILKLKKFSYLIDYKPSNDKEPFSMLLSWFIDLFKILFNIEVFAFFQCIKKLEIHRERIDQLFQYIGEVDIAQSMANLQSSDLPICTPTFDDQFKIENLIHPLIKDCQPNSLSLEKKGVLLTGSNMSGKTTFIRTIAINTLFAQNFGFCFGSSYQAPFQKIYSSIRISDNIQEKSSYYLEEVRTVKKIITASERHEACLFVMDELFKGTNTFERVKGAHAILEFLIKGPHHVFVATHDIELTELLINDYELWHFAESVEQEDIVFDHQIKKGKLTQLNAIKILSLYDYPEEIIQHAQASKIKRTKVNNIVH